MPVTAAAVYARISSDVEGSGQGVTRQLEDCRRLAGELGWLVAEEYVDNDLSAYSGKTRPGYERMLADLRDGTRDAVLVYHVDRLTRRPIELEQFVAALDAARVLHVRFVVGDMDLGSGDGLLVARILAAMAANESATKSRRVLRKLDQVAAEGRPHGGSQRPYGYAANKVTVLPDEAAVVRTVVARFLAGESLRSLARWLEAEGITTVAGGTWRTPTLRQMLGSPRIAGLRQHRGQVVGPAVWEPIITEQQRDQVLARLDTLSTSGRRSPRRYLLSGLLRCGRCDHVLFSAARETTRRYVCLSGPDHPGGCGRLTVVAAPLEQLVADAVIYRLDTPELADTLAGRAAATTGSDTAAEELAEDRRRLDELAGFYAAGRIRAHEWFTARTAIEARVRDSERRLARAAGTSVLTGLVGHGGALREQWGTLNLDRQVAIVRTVLADAVIAAGTPGARSLDPARVMPRWAL